MNIHLLFVIITCFQFPKDDRLKQIRLYVVQWLHYLYNTFITKLFVKMFIQLFLINKISFSYITAVGEHLTRNAWQQ